MSKATRLQYLQAMGIDVWIPRVNSAANSVQPEAVEQNRVKKDVVEATESAGVTSVEKTDYFIQNMVKKWQELEHEVAECQQCSLCQTRTQTVFGSGNINADWMLIGEAPGQSEDREGLPFVGRAGQLLTEMIRALGLAREQVYIANILKCRPPNNRDPKPEEVAACNDHLQRQIALVQPKIILAVGRVAAQNLLQTDASLSQLRGKVHYCDNVPVIVIYHPAYLLRSLLEKRKAWQDLQSALKFFRSVEN